jgi:hypothetical protein
MAKTLPTTPTTTLAIKAGANQGLWENEWRIWPPWVMDYRFRTKASGVDARCRGSGAADSTSISGGGRLSMGIGHQTPTGGAKLRLLTTVAPPYAPSLQLTCSCCSSLCATIAPRATVAKEGLVRLDSEN